MIPFELCGCNAEIFTRLAALIAGFPPSLSPLLQELLELRLGSVIGCTVTVEMAGDGFTNTTCSKMTWLYSPYIVSPETLVADCVFDFLFFWPFALVLVSLLEAVVFLFCCCVVLSIAYRVFQCMLGVYWSDIIGILFY